MQEGREMEKEKGRETIGQPRLPSTVPSQDPTYSLDTAEPIAMSNQIRRQLTHLNHSKDLTAKHLILLKQEMYGDFIQSLDSIEHLTSQFNLYLTDKETYFDLPRIIESITLKDILAIGKAFFEKADISDFTVFPK